MGSIEQINRTINQQMTNIITNVIQNASTTSTAIQSLNVDCEKYNEILGKYTMDCLDIFKDFSPDDKLKLCEAPFKCGGNDIRISGVINVNVDSKQESAIQTTIENKIKENVEQVAKQEIGFFSMGDTLKTKINNFSKMSTNIINHFIQNTLSKADSIQTVNIKGGWLNTISMEQLVDMIDKSVLDNKWYTKILNEMSTSILQRASQNQGVLGSPIKILITLSIIGVIIFIMIGIFLWILKKK